MQCGRFPENRSSKSLVKKFVTGHSGMTEILQLLGEEEAPFAGMAYVQIQFRIWTKENEFFLRTSNHCTERADQRDAEKR